MPTLSSMFKLINNFSGPAQQIISASDSATKAIDNASKAADDLNEAATNMSTGTTKSAQAMQLAHKYIDQGYSRSEALSKAWDDVGRSAKNARPSVKGVGDEIGRTASKATGLTGSLTGLIAKIGGLIAVKKGMDISDDMTNLTARLNNMNDGLQTTAELQNKIFSSAERARGSYNDMAGAVTRLGTLASDAFGSNDEIIAFTELLQKSFKVSGASISEQSAAMTQLSQAMASGRLQGDEYVSIMENAPAVIQSIADYLGVTKGELKEMSSDGAITADIIKAAMFASADDINNKFETMPRTFSDIWTGIKNDGLQAINTVIQKVNQLINTTQAQRAIASIRVGFKLAADAASWLIDTIINNWPTIQTILILITTVHLITMIAKLWAIIPPLLAQAAAWLACCWPILLVIAIVAIAIAAARQFGASWEDILGFVGGIIGVFATFFINIFITIWNTVADFINFFTNCFKNPVASIQILFLNLAKTVIGIVKTLVQGIEDLINLIPGVEINITGGLDNLYDNIESKVGDIKSESEWEEVVQRKEFVDFSEGWTNGQEIGSNVADTLGGAVGDISNILNGIDMSSASTGFDVDWSSFGADGAIPIEGTGKSGKEVKVDISDENLEYIKEITERAYVVQLKQDVLRPDVKITFGDVHETADLKELQKELERVMDEELSTGKEGD